MTISSITPLSNVTSTSSVSSLTAPATQSNTDAPPEAGPGGAHFSKMGSLMSQLQNLETTDPAKAKQVLTSIASALSDKAKASGNADPHLQELADKFSQAAQTGDLSGLKPSGPPGGAHEPHHHHHASAGGADGSGTGTSPAAASASYQQNGHNPMADVESIISNALNAS